MTEKSKLPGSDDHDVAVKNKVALIDPETLAVLWTNEPPDAGGEGVSAESIPLEEAIPMAEALGLREVLRVVARTGASQDLRADLVTTARGTMVMVVSTHRLPDGKLLVLTENMWLVASRAAERGAGRSRRRRR